MEHERKKRYASFSLRKENISRAMVEDIIPKTGCRKYPYTLTGRQAGKAVISTVHDKKKISLDKKKYRKWFSAIQPVETTNRIMGIAARKERMPYVQYPPALRRRTINKIMEIVTRTAFEEITRLRTSWSSTLLTPALKRFFIFTFSRDEAAQICAQK
jgi:hypothetical protein